MMILMNTVNEMMINAYFECALWASVHIDEDGNTTPMDELADFSDFDTTTWDELADDMLAFADEYYTEEVAELWSISQFGHDFWLTRNGHGAGFWDRGHGDIGDRLTEAAKVYGEAVLYIGDDGKVYV